MSKSTSWTLHKLLWGSTEKQLTNLPFINSTRLSGRPTLDLEYMLFNCRYSHLLQFCVCILISLLYFFLCLKATVDGEFGTNNTITVAWGEIDLPRFMSYFPPISALKMCMISTCSLQLFLWYSIVIRFLSWKVLKWIIVKDHAFLSHSCEAHRHKIVLSS